MEKNGKDFDLQGHLPFRIATASNLLAMSRDIRFRKMSGLDIRAMRVLIVIGTLEPVSAADVAWQSRLETTMVSRAVKDLKNRKLIDTCPDPAHQRRQILSLTSEGRDLFEQFVALMAEREEHVFGSFSTEERQLLAALLKKVELRTEELLADVARAERDAGSSLPADQRELIRWHRKSSKPDQVT